MSVSRAQTILAEADLRPHLTEQWVMSELGPEFDAQAAEVCGLYVDPPANAVVVSVDEKTSIAAREPARPTPRRRLVGPPAATASTCATAPRTCSPRSRSTRARCRA